MKTTNSHAYEQLLVKRSTPRLQFDGSLPLEEWRPLARARLEELLGLPLATCAPETTVESTLEQEDHTQIRFTVQTEPGYFVPCYLLIPRSVKKPVPLTLCLSGHCTGMHIPLGQAKSEDDEKTLQEWPHRAMGPRALREGRCALIIEARNFGESSLEGYGCTCTEAAKIALLMGRTVLGERVWDAMRILDAVAETFPQVDMSDIVCTGNSGGGTATYYLACLEERITVAAPCCSVCTYEDSIIAMPHCLCNHIPGIRKYFEMGDLAGLIAPRKLVVAAGQEDPIFPIHGVRRTMEQIERIYQAAGVPEHCALVVGELGHYNYADHIWSKLHAMGV